MRRRSREVEIVERISRKVGNREEGGRKGRGCC